MSKKGLNKVKIWEKIGLSKTTYYDWMKKGLSLDEIIEKNKNQKELKFALKLFGKSKKETRGRFSGLNYINSEQELNAIKEKYKNGVTAEMMESFFDGRGFVNKGLKNE